MFTAPRWAAKWAPGARGHSEGGGGPLCITGTTWYTLPVSLRTHPHSQADRQKHAHNHRYCPRQQRTRTKSSGNINKTVVYGVLNSSHSAACVIWADSWCCLQQPQQQHLSLIHPLHHFQENAQIYKANGESGVLLKGRNTRNPSLCFLQLCDPIPSIQCGRDANEKEGGATSWGGTHSTRVSTVVVFHYIFKSRDRWAGGRDGETESVCGWWGGERGILGGRETKKDDVLLFSLPLIIYTSHCCGMCVWVILYTNADSRPRQSLSEMSLQEDAPIYVCVCKRERVREIKRVCGRAQGSGVELV